MSWGVVICFVVSLLALEAKKKKKEREQNDIVSGSSLMSNSAVASREDDGTKISQLTGPKRRKAPNPSDTGPAHGSLVMSLRTQTPLTKLSLSTCLTFRPRRRKEF